MSIFVLFKIIIIGLVEGITEWLPISSTGHMILFEEILKINSDLSPEFMEMFRVVIQLGAIMAVVVLFWNKLFPIKKTDHGSFTIDTNTLILWAKIIVSCIPAAVIGFIFDDFLEEKLYNYVVVAIMLILYGIFFILVEIRNKNKKAKINKLQNLDYKTAFGIGLFQVLALIPGTSRSGATILGGILLGTDRTTASEFTFFLAIPVMFGASLLKVVKYVAKVGLAFSGAEVIYLIGGILVAFIVSIAAIRFLMGYIKKHDFKAFGYYRIVLGAVVLAFFFLLK